MFLKISRYCPALDACLLKLDSYFSTFLNQLQSSVQEEKKRMSKIIHSITLTQMSSDEDELSILEKLQNKDYQGITCQQISLIAKKLLAFVPQVGAVDEKLKFFQNYIENQ